MYRGLTIFTCANCGHQFKSHDIEYCASSLSVPQRCPKCGSIRTLPFCGSETAYEIIWQAMEHAEKQREERLLHLEEKRKANEKEERKRREKKRKHLSQKQREAYDKKRAKKQSKRSKATSSINEPKPQKDEIILFGPTWFPPGTPLRIEET